MNESLVRWVIIPGTICILLFICKHIRRKVAKPRYKNAVQTPGNFDNGLLTLIKVLTIIPIILMLLGFITKKTEMASANAILTLVFIGITLFLQREYTMSYQENEEFFILTAKKNTVQIFFEDIVDWQPGINEISVLDRTGDPQKYIKVNISIFKPELLLKKIAEKTFSGHFLNIDISNTEDPNREQELIYFYHFYGYGYLLKEYSSRFKKHD